MPLTEKEKKAASQIEVNCLLREIEVEETQKELLKKFRKEAKVTTPSNSGWQSTLRPSRDEQGRGRAATGPSR